MFVQFFLTNIRIMKFRKLIFQLNYFVDFVQFIKLPPFSFLDSRNAFWYISIPIEYEFPISKE